MKVVSPKESIYDMIGREPQIQAVMIELGFSEIAKPGMLQTVGRIMTLEKGSKMKGIPMQVIKEVFEKAGYRVEEV